MHDVNWYAGTTKSVKGKPALIKIQGQGINQRTNDPVNAHLLREPCISTKHTKPKNKVKIDHVLQYSLTFIYCIHVSCLHLQIFRPLAAIVS